MVQLTKIWVTPKFWWSPQEDRRCCYVTFHPHYFPSLSSPKQEIVSTKIILGDRVMRHACVCVGRLKQMGVQGIKKNAIFLIRLLISTYGQNHI